MPLRSLALSLTLSALVGCGSQTIGSGASDDRELLPADSEPRIDRRLDIPLGKVGAVTDGTLLHFNGVTGPSSSDGVQTYTLPLTAQTTLEHAGANSSVDLKYAQFVVAKPFVVAYLGVATGAVTDAASPVLVGHFRIAEEYPLPASFGVEFRLRVTSPATLPDGRRLRLTSFSANRCPCYAMCFWEGLSTVEVSLFSGGENIGSATFDNLLGPLGPSTSTIDDLTLKANAVVLPKCDGYIDDGYVDLTVE